MSFFKFAKKKEIDSCSCSAENTSKCCPEIRQGVCCVKVLGAGCKSCHEMYENTKSAIKNMGLNIEVDYITDMQSIMKYGVMSMPALVVDEKISSQGKVLKAADIEKLLNATLD